MMEVWVLFLLLGEGKPEGEVRTRMEEREEEMAYWDFVMWVVVCVVVGWEGVVMVPEVEPEVGVWEVVGVPEEEEEEEDEDAISGFEIPNWVEYWNLPVASSMICRP